MAISRKQVGQFLSRFSQWAADQPEIRAVALVGSYARNEATDTSDVDLIIISSAPDRYLQNTRWAQRFGAIDRQQFEGYSNVTSLRVWYSGSHEVEYGIADETWAASPLNEGTRQVISDGMRILFERGPVLSRLLGTEDLSNP